jgi:hypothetical protein
MGSEHYDRLLDRAAILWGIDPEFWDIWGGKHVTSPATKRALLGGLGVDADSEAGLEQALERRFRKEWTRLLPASLVVGEGAPLELPVTAPEELAHGAVRVRLRQEDGRTE